MSGDPRRLLAVFAHPDDEGLVSGAFAHYRQQGARVALICATRGEVGEIAPGVNATKETLGAVRTQELHNAMSHIGVGEIYFLDYRDSGMMGTPENEDPVNLHNAPLDEVTGKVVKIVRAVKPQVMLTFDPQGGYGHPDHLKVHAAAMAAFAKAGDPTCYPEQLTNGVAAYAPQKIYWPGFSPEFFEAVARYLKEAGVDLSQFGPFNPERRAVGRPPVTTRLDVAPYLEAKARAWQSHASQQNPNGLFSKIPPELVQKFRQQESFTLAESRVPRADGLEDDLFHGVVFDTPQM
ncbi:MAG: PIG-L family deacetylase [Chloroflexi bacterium]|nr:PIG-L family deacetylase [Chloroflexota bacterium]